MADTTPVVAIKCLKVGEFQGTLNYKLSSQSSSFNSKLVCLINCVEFVGVSLSTLSRSTVLINPDLPESEKLRTW